MKKKIKPKILKSNKLKAIFAATAGVSCNQWNVRQTMEKLMLLLSIFHV